VANRKITEGKGWFLKIFIARCPKIFPNSVGRLELIFHGNQVIKSKIITLKIQLIGVYVPWDPGGQKLRLKLMSLFG
jgi:hypothetical protein